MKIISYNVNGIRSALTKGLDQWIHEIQPDLVCLQEIKADVSAFNSSLFEDMGYHVNLFPAEKKGYSGVAVLSKQKPLNVAFGMNETKYDFEGRSCRVDFEDFSVMSLYLPSGSSGDERQSFKMEMLEWFYVYVNQLRTQIPNLILSGDFNICHKPIDIHDPIRNATSSGFLPEEREWFTRFIDSGWIDTFRVFHPEPHQYSWWSYRAGARKNNKGWRIDYHLATDTMRERLSSACIHQNAIHSDHCPIELVIS
jgi:exodeoxyribonuclease-3